jgi:O-antigen/teichoic acid export membrane protein
LARARRLSGLAASLVERLRTRGTQTRDVAATFLTNLIVAGISLGTAMLVARLFRPAGRGQLAAIQAWPNLVAIVAAFGVQDAVIFRGSKEPNRAGGYAASGAVLILALGVPAGLVVSWLLPYLLSSQSHEVIRTSQLYVAFALVAGAANTSSLALTRATQRTLLWNGLRVGAVLAWLAVLVGMWISGNRSPTSAVWLYAVAIWVFSIVSLGLVRSSLRGQWRPRVAACRQLLPFVLPNWLAVAIQMLSQRADQLVTCGLLADREVGFYAVAVSWAALASLGSTAVSAVAFPRIAAQGDPASQLRAARRSLLVGSLVALGCAIVLALAAPLGIRLLFGRDFIPALLPALMLLAAALLRAMSDLVQSASRGLGKPSHVALSEAGGAVTGLPLALLLVPRHGMLGAATAAVASGAAVLCVASWRLWGHAKRMRTQLVPPDVADKSSGVHAGA